ncbi:MAG: hypothetical protein AAFU61_00970 [Pseudomonadota bacterium]
MSFVSRLAIFAALIAPAGPAWAQSPASLTDHAQTCRHYENRATFKPRGPGAGLEVRAAEQCRAALETLRRGGEASPERAARARAYLDRLTRLKRTVIAMNVDRIYGAEAGRRAMPKAPAEGRGQAQVRGVTRTGEYLIARDLGVLQALEAWRHHELELAKAPPEIARP